MEFCHDCKVNQGFNNMEDNIYRGLQDLPTVTELAVLSLFGQVVSIPYMQEVRSGSFFFLEKNMLDMGPFHDHVKSHINQIAANLDLLHNVEKWHTTGHLTGGTWENPEVFTALKQEEAGLPYLRQLLVAFSKGAREKWDSFTSEFAPGGIITTLSAEEKRRAFMPTTNDMSEGMLGRWRVWARDFASLSQHRFNSMMMYKTNGTEAFI